VTAKKSESKSVDVGAVVSIIASLLQIVAELAKQIGNEALVKDVKKLIKDSGLPSLPRVARDHAERARRVLRTGGL